MMIVRPTIVLAAVVLTTSIASPARADPREVLRVCQAVIKRVDQSAQDASVAKPDEAEDWKQNINPNSLQVVNGFVEPSLANAAAGMRYQFERSGYFCVDPDSTPEKLVFNRTVTLRDTWGKIEKHEQ